MPFFLIPIVAKLAALAKGHGVAVKVGHAAKGAHGKGLVRRHKKKDRTEIEVEVETDGEDDNGQEK